MMVIRPVERNDLAALIQLAGKTGGGLTSLPADEQTLLARIERAIHTWQGTVPKGEQGYVFVLEESETGTVAGICTDIAIITHKPANVLKRALAQHQQFIQPRALVGVIDNGSNPQRSRGLSSPRPG
jgi:hypothetical protein